MLLILGKPTLTYISSTPPSFDYFELVMAVVLFVVELLSVLAFIYPPWGDLLWVWLRVLLTCAPGIV